MARVYDEGVYRARDMLAPEPMPMLDKPAIPSYVTRYGGMGEIRKDEDEIAGMRAAMVGARTGPTAATTARRAVTSTSRRSAAQLRTARP